MSREKTSRSSADGLGCGNDFVEARITAQSIPARISRSPGASMLALVEKKTVQELKSTAAKQEATIAELKSTVAQQQKGIEALTTGLEKVTAQLQLIKPAPRTVLNDQ